MTVCDRANFLAETLTQVHRSGQDNVFCAESCQLKHILRNFDLYHNRVTTIFLAKLFPLYWVHLMHSTHVITRVLVKEAHQNYLPRWTRVIQGGHDENFESGLHNQKHKFEQYKFSISRFTAQSKLFEGKKTEWKFICYVVLFLPFSPSLLFSCLLCNVDKTLPIWQMFIFHHSKKDSFTRVLSNICISYGQDFSSLRTTLAAEC